MLFFFELGGGTQHPNMDKQHLEDFLRLLRGEVDFLPPDLPTSVRVILAGSKQGMTRHAFCCSFLGLSDLRQIVSS